MVKVITAEWCDVNNGITSISSFDEPCIKQVFQMVSYLYGGSVRQFVAEIFGIKVSITVRILFNDDEQPTYKVIIKFHNTNLLLRQVYQNLSKTAGAVFFSARKECAA